MLTPLIANRPFQGPSPSPIAGHGAAEGRSIGAPQRDAKEAFGTLFHKDSTPKEAVQTPHAQETSLSDEPETAKAETGAESEAEVTGDLNRADVIAQEGAQELADPEPDAGNMPLAGAALFSPDTHVQITEAGAEQNKSAQSFASSPAADQTLTPNSVDSDTAPFSALTANTTAGTNAQLVTEQSLLPDQKRQSATIAGAPFSNQGVAASATRSVANMPVDPARVTPLAANAVGAMTKGATSGGTGQDPTLTALLDNVLPGEAAQGHTVRADRLTAPVNQIPPGPQTLPITPGQYVDPAQVTQNLVTKIAVSEDSDQPLVFEARAPVGSTAATAMPTQALLQRADLPQHIAMQIAAAAQRGGADRPIALILNPAELGPVRLSLSSADGVISVTVMAERPETLDLMRRHIDTLAQEFLNIGYGKAQFSFGGGQSGQTGQERADGTFSSSGGSGPQPPTADSPSLHHSPILISDRLDIRL